MWRLTDNVAQLESELLSASIDTTNPEAGIRDVTWSAGNEKNSLPGPLLRILFLRAPHSPSLHLAEVYQRHQDLVATYEEMADPRVRPQVYWRSVCSTVATPAPGFEIILSVQTSTLDSRPTVLVESQLGVSSVRVFQDEGNGQLQPASNVSLLNLRNLPRNSSVFLARLADSNYSYLEMAFPADFHDSSITPAVAGSLVTINHHLHTDRLEKGVIRRCRIRSLLIPAQDDEAIAARCYQEFLDSPLPLTT